MIDKQNIWTYTFGCKVNQVDTESMERQVLGQANINQWDQNPNTILINTCSVTKEADRQARQLIRKMHRTYPKAKIIVTGCYAQREPQSIEKIEGVGLVLPILNQQQWVDHVGLERQDEPQVFAYTKKSRAFLKIQDGCNAYCAFCVLPYVRKKSRSIDINEIQKTVHSFVKLGHVEMVITGTHIAGFGRDLAKRMDLTDGLKHILSVDPQFVVRISSLEPSGLTSKFLRFVKSEDRILPHFHIPLQSGSDEVLRRMNRKYKVMHYEQRINELSLTKPKVSIGTDVIVGYPQETLQEFDQTVKLIEKLPLTYLHVFPFSAREETKAFTLIDDVPKVEKKRRVHVLRTLSHQKRKAFYESFLGKTCKILVEKKRSKEGFLTGYSEHYIPVVFEGNDRLKEKKVDVVLQTIEVNGLDQMHVRSKVE